MKRLLLTSVIFCGCLGVASAQQAKQKKINHPKTSEQRAQLQAYKTKRMAEKLAIEKQRHTPSDKLQKAPVTPH